MSEVVQELVAEAPQLNEVELLKDLQELDKKLDELESQLEKNDDAMQMLLKDFVDLAAACKTALDRSVFSGKDAKEAATALIMCEHVLSKYVKKSEA